MNFQGVGWTLVQHMGKAEPAWTPASPTDGGALPVVWFKADAGLFQDAAKTIPAVVDGDPVGAWVSQGSNAISVLKVGADSTRPTLKLGIQYGQPVLRFDGADFLRGALATALTQPFHIFTAAQLGASVINDGNDYTMLASDDITNWIILYKVGNTTPDKWRMFGDGVGINGSPADSNWNVWEALYNGVSGQLWLNGTSDATGNVGTDNPDGLTVGAISTAASFWIGDVGEILAYDPSLSLTDQIQVRNYLMAKWRNNHGGISFDILSPTTLHDNGYTTDQTSYLQSSPFARWKFTSAATQMRVTTFNNIFGTYPAWTHVGVFINGASFVTLAGTTAGGESFDVALPAGTKTIEIVVGLQSNPAGTVLGTFLRSIYFVGNNTSIVLPDAPSNRVLVYGDSIAVGANAVFPTSQGWPVLLRTNIPVAIEAWGFRSLYDDANTAGLRAAFVAQLASFAPGSVWLAIGTNDYALNKWTAANFGTAYAALLDDLRTSLPSATIYCQTPIKRTTETANGLGSTLGDYRTQINTAVSTRGPWAILVDGTDAAFPQAPGDLDDGVHPTTAGHTKYYTAVKAALGL